MPSGDAKYIVDKILFWFILAPLICGAIYLVLNSYEGTTDRRATASEQSIADSNKALVDSQQRVQEAKRETQLFDASAEQEKAKEAPCSTRIKEADRQLATWQQKELAGLSCSDEKQMKAQWAEEGFLNQ
jgi:cell division protein FtsL